MNKSSSIQRESHSRQLRQTGKPLIDKTICSLDDGSNSDAKEESGCGSSSSVRAGPNNCQENILGDGDMSVANDPSVFVPINRLGGSDVIEELQSTPGSFSLENDGVGGNVLSIVASNGLHHRHHVNTVGHAHSYQSIASPNRRRRTLVRSSTEHLQSRRRKCTVMHIFRSMLLAGATIYFFLMLRGTQILMQHHDVNDYKPEPSHGRLSEYFPMQLPSGYAAHPAIRSHLRPGATRDSLAPFIRKPGNDNPDEVKAAWTQSVVERRKRTRPPSLQPTDLSVPGYAIISTRNGQSAHHSPKYPQLAKEVQLCGVCAQQARENSPESFVATDALLTLEARVLITGIISNPLAFHLALKLMAHCGVEILFGIDPLLPNSISKRMQQVEQMGILSSNAPKMQPILVPLLGLDPRVKKPKKETASEHPMMLELTGELNLLNFEPTHIVHLSSATYQNPISTNVKLSPLNPNRPLAPFQISKDDSYDPSLFQIRSSMASMEHILTSMVSNAQVKDSAPHLTYASAAISGSQAPARDDVVLSYSKQVDEVLANTYYTLFGAYSVGVRYPPNAIYGPWDTETTLHHLLHEAINGNYTVVDKGLGEQELIYVQDAVDAIVSAMQFRGNGATKFDLHAKPAVALSEVATFAESLLKPRATSASDLLVALPQYIERSDQTRKMLMWRPSTPLRYGLLKTIAWIFDRSTPHGPPFRGSATRPSSVLPVRGTGDALLLANSVSTCASDDLACHAGPKYLPCASECSTKAQCQKSIFDSVQPLTREMTEGCEAVLYTQSLGRDAEDLQLQSQFEDDAEPAICNLAFVVQSSPLVNAVIQKIPKEDFERLGVPAMIPFDDKIKKLNGRLLYRGWILIWVDPVDTVSLADSSLMKLSPGRMFADDVLYAVFVEENFTVSPTTDDVRFLISQMDRGATKPRSIYRMLKKDEQSKPKKIKFKIQAQPEKRASILVSQLKFKISERVRIPQDTKISIMDAVRFMRFEIGSDPSKQKESSAIKRQKDFYRRIPTFINGKDLRDNFAPIYKYELNHWVRTRWVVHDLTLEESRELRCEWYQEHIQWGSEIDQLSFAAVLARRILYRRLTLDDPDDRSRPKTPSLELKDFTDHNEWLAMAAEPNKLHSLQNSYLSGAREVLGNESKDEVEEEEAEDGPEVPSGSRFSTKKRPIVALHVRIISDRIMSLSRKAWARYRSELAVTQMQVQLKA